ncbi:MAG: FIST C-terminal domain-containing protein [Spirochaetales bacterium]|jgi:hypothetical protein|nr:FIST C-terminal domain-containing protein [Spirochaetales bacterium]
MIKMIAAYTRELDDPEKATEEILRQFDPQKDLLAHSAGLLFCYSEFLELGVVDSLCKKLPFSVAGCTSQCFAVPGVSDEIMLTLLVLTSDDVEFAAGVSGPLTHDMDRQISSLYKELSASLSGPPVLAFTMLPLNMNYGGDTVFLTLERAAGGSLPFFGTCALDADTKIRNPMTIFNGAAYNDNIALLLLSGNVTPHFFSASLPEKTSFALDAIVTRADGNKILTINNLPAGNFMEKLGISRLEPRTTLFAIPIFADYHTGEPPDLLVIRDIGEDGSVICTTNVAAGCTLNVGSLTADFVLASAKELVCQIKNSNAVSSGVLLFSCLNRNIAMADPTAELEAVQKEFENFPFPWLFMYATGEICPLHTEANTLRNHFNQYALIACAL